MEVFKYFKWRINPDLSILQFIESNVAISVSDNLGRIIYTNNRFCSKMESKENELLGVVNSIFLSKIHKAPFYKNLWKTLETGCLWKGVLNYKTKSEKIICFETTIVPLKDNKGIVESYVFMYLDACESKLDCHQTSYTQYS
ncbi:PAS domain-containing protein [uncultured Algibacter sp.]|uniref:PAS domain-containing protein n=1 Tax=uncultured Algibacter sp. TaxID=298659 RepID=UPI0030EC04C0|tara:strand:- start:1501 stop:1926 length:426 start_codon:yes stop_codon:yes gene_type:complete